MVVSVLTAVVGVWVIAYTLLSAVRTVILPRGEITWLGLVVFQPLGALFRAITATRPSFAAKDRVMALYAPIGLVMLPALWASLVLIGFMLVFWAVGDYSWEEAFTISGSSLLTLGFATVEPVGQRILVFIEATLGLGIVALLITFLPSIYQAFSRREALVALLEVRAGSPPTAEEFLLRHHRILGLDRLMAEWSNWERWFVELEESHLSYPALVFFRSQHPERSWITAAGTVLDAASLAQSALDLPPQPNAALAIRAGYLALRPIADYFNIANPDDPHPTDPVTIQRAEFERTLDRLEAEGLPVKADRDQAWRDFAGWRVNYDACVLGLAALVVAPRAPWTSDRPPLGAPVTSAFRFGRLRRRSLDADLEAVDG